jgi:hypothetical protein
MKKRTRRTDTSASTHNTEDTPTKDYSISYAWTISGLIAYLNTLCHTLLLYLGHLYRIREDLSMGILDWVQGRKEEGEMVPLTDLDSEDGEDGAQKGRQGNGDIKRRRHHVNKGMYRARKEWGKAHCFRCSRRTDVFPRDGQSEWDIMLYELGSPGTLLRFDLSSVYKY